MTEAITAPSRAPALAPARLKPAHPRPRTPRTRRAAVLFDLDGVLWNSNSVHAQAFREVALANNLVAVDYEELAGLSTEAAWSEILRRSGQHVSAERLSGLSDAKRQLARRVLAERPPLAAGVDLLAVLTSAGLPVGLVTGSSKATVDVFLEAVGQPGRFSVVVTADQTRRCKPAPDPYLHAAHALDVAPQDCWVLEDSVSGLASAVAAGARVVHLATERCRKPHGPAVLACVADIRSFVRLAVDEDGS